MPRLTTEPAGPIYRATEPAVANLAQELERRTRNTMTMLPQGEAYTRGQIWHAEDAQTLLTLEIGADGDLLVASGGVPTWTTTLPGTYTFTGPVIFNNTITIDSWALGSMGFTDGSSVFTELTVGAPGEILGIGAGIPAWVTPATYLAQALLNGTFHPDTAATAPTLGDLIVADATPVWDALAAGVAGAPLVINPAGVPAWVVPIAGAGAILHNTGLDTLWTTELRFTEATQTLTVGITATGIITSGTGEALEIRRQDGFAWVTLSSVLANALITLDTVLKDGVEWNYGNTNDSGILWSVVQANDGMVIWSKVNTVTESGAIIFTAEVNHLLDHGYAITPDVRIYVASTAAPTTGWISIHHDGDGQILTGAGDLNLTPAGIVVANALAVSDLTSGRIPFVTIASRLTDSPTLTFDGNGIVILASATAPLVSLFIQNTTDAVGRLALLFLQVAGAASNNPYILFQVSGVTSWTTGIDNGAGDAYKISESVTLGGSDRFIIDVGGVTAIPARLVVGATAAPNSLLESAGSFAAEIDTVAISTTLTDQHHTVKGDASGGPITFTLPAAASVPRRIYRLKKIDASANAVTVDANGAELIDGALTAVIAAQWDSIDVQSDGTVWSIH